MGGLISIVVGLIIILLLASVRIINQYERGVVFRLGRLNGKVREPGICVIIPIVDHLRKISLRIITQPVDSQRL
jgi:regulator of protease activity HflC (stomatin/prohibitin superfamily)